MQVQFHQRLLATNKEKTPATTYPGYYYLVYSTPYAGIPWPTQTRNHRGKGEKKKKERKKDGQKKGMHLVLRSIE